MAERPAPPQGTAVNGAPRAFRRASTLPSSLLARVPHDKGGGDAQLRHFFGRSGELDAFQASHLSGWFASVGGGR